MWHFYDFKLFIQMLQIIIPQLNKKNKQTQISAIKHFHVKLTELAGKILQMTLQKCLSHWSSNHAAGKRDFNRVCQLLWLTSDLLSHVKSDLFWSDLGYFHERVAHVQTWVWYRPHFRQNQEQNINKNRSVCAKLYFHLSDQTVKPEQKLSWYNPRV